MIREFLPRPGETFGQWWRRMTQYWNGGAVR